MSGFDPETNTWTGQMTEQMLGIHIGADILYNIHDDSKCAGRGCSIHHPSNHHQRDWPMVWRGDKGMFERSCSHGVGHPDKDDVAYLKSIDAGYLTTHGCDGCCVKNEDSSD